QPSKAGPAERAAGGAYQRAGAPARHAARLAARLRPAAQLALYAAQPDAGPRHARRAQHPQQPGPARRDAALGAAGAVGHRPLRNQRR
nr:hypothetical protein [Tanacetum cinerariifolium]